MNEEWPILIKATSDVIQIQKPDYTKPFILSTDASEYGMGMVLTQATDNNGRVIIGCNSQGLSKSEKLWAIAQKELYAKTKTRKIPKILVLFLLIFQLALHS